MTLWMVRAGKYGEQEQAAIQHNLIAIGWIEIPDLASIRSKDELYTVYYENNPAKNKNQAANVVGQIWRFKDEIAIGDLVGLPLKSQSAIVIGKVVGEYEYRKDVAENIRHTRKVEWVRIIPRSEFDQDLLYSFGAFMTVCSISRNDAEVRVKEMIGKKKPERRESESKEEREEIIDIEQFARDQIEKVISIKFKGHNLARLVNELLIAQGYSTHMSPPGPDGGVDILAASGTLGFLPPRICVQVKSTSAPSDVRVLRELQGVMTKLRADQGLLVSWGGFTAPAMKEANDSFFSTRLWDSGKLIKAIFQHYDKFDDDLKTELPLKKIWSLVLEED